MKPATTNPADWLVLQRTVRFGDTDAAGVMHFQQLLRWCHEAYEESLERFGIPAAAVFPTPSWFQPAGEPEHPQTLEAPRVALPIIHCRADFRRPLVCGDGLNIQLRPERVAPDCFEIAYTFRKPEPRGAGFSETASEMATALTRHRAIDASQRTRCALPDPIACWLRRSAEESVP